MVRGSETAKHGTFVVSIPKERVAILIGQEGRTKRIIEERLGVKLKIDSDSGVVEITLARSVEEGGDPVALFQARDVVEAIGSGFSPERALKLIGGDNVLVTIDISEYIGKDRSNLTRVKARIIGSRGKTRKIIEENAHVDVSIYGNKVAIIGFPEDAAAAQEAVMMLINGSPHSSVYRFLDNYAQRRKLSRGYSYIR